MRRNPVLWTLVVLLLLAGPVLWLLFAPGDVPPLPRLGPVAPRVRDPVTQAVAEPTRHRSSAPAEAGADPPPASPAKPPPIPTPPANPAPHVALLVRLEGLLEDIPAADTAVHVRSCRKPRRRKGEQERDEPAEADPRELTANAGRSAVFLLDCTDLVEEEGTRDAIVSVDRAGYVPVEVPTQIGGDKQRSVSIALVPAGWAVGVVEDDLHRPIFGADVAVFSARGEGWVIVDAVETAEDGSYRARLAPGVVDMVVAACDGFLPVHTELTGHGRLDSNVPYFTLRQGLGVSGTVRFADGRPASGFAYASPVDAKPTLVTPTRRFAFVGPTLEECPAAGPIENGAFRVDGLLPGEDDVYVAVPGVSSTICLALRQRVAPSADGLEFVIDGAVLDVRVTSNGRNVPSATVTLTRDIDTRKGKVAQTTSAEAEATAETDAEGKALLVAVGHATYSLQVSAKGAQPFTTRIEAPASGETRRVLVRL